MSIYTNLTNDSVVSTRPCKLLSITMTNFGSGDGRVDIYNERSAVASQKVVTLTQGSNDTIQFRWEGLEFDRGLYVNIVERTDDLTIEWEPIWEPPEGKSVVEYIIESAS